MLTLSVPRLSKTKKSSNIILDDESKVIFFIVLVSQAFFNNGVYLFLSTACLFAVFYFLQKPFKPGVFTFIALQHFLQIIAGVWLANYAEKDINFKSSATSVATLASLIGVLFLFLPVMYYQNKLPVLTLNDLKKYAYKLSIDKTLYCYIAVFFFTSFMGSIALASGGYAQVILSMVKIKWLFFLLFGFQSILKKQRTQIFYACILFEFVTGFYSYFSDFKTVLYYLIILLLSLLQIINLKKLILGSILAGFLFFFAILWTQVKNQYRNYLNAGQKKQVVTVSQDEALNKLYTLSNEVDEAKFNTAIYQFLDRLQYTYHFSKTIERVPEIIPYTNGQNWLDNLEYVTTPRIFNPDKPRLEATEKTKKYTGLRYAGFKKGVSFSLGYFAECYIDFGLWGMMIPLFLIGLLYGKIYWYLMRESSSNLVFNYSVVGAFFMEFFAYEQDGTLLIGKIFSSIVTFYVLLKFFFPAIVRYVSNPDS